MEAKDYQNSGYFRRKNYRQILKKNILNLVVCFVMACTVLSYGYHVFAFFDNCSLFIIKNSSMYPTLNEDFVCNDTTIVDSSLEIKAGNVAIFSILSGTDLVTQNIVKRVVAVGGDKISVARIPQNGSYVYRLQIIAKGETESKVLQEDYVKDQSSLLKTYQKFEKLYKKSSVQTQVIDEQTYIVIPDDCVFLLGDNRNVSYDSSDYGPVSKNHYVGTVVFVMPQSRLVTLYQVLYCFGLVKSNMIVC